MTSRERIKAILNWDIPDHIGFNESPWGETHELWQQQGLPKDQSVVDYFGMDLAHIGFFDCSFRFPDEVIEESDEAIIRRDANGVTSKVFKKGSGFTPHWLDHVIKTQEDWNRYRDRLMPSPDRIHWKVKEELEKAQKTGRFVAHCHADPYEMTWPLFGQVGIFTLMMDDPKFVAGVFMTYADLLIGLYEELRKQGIEYDGVFMYTDLGYRNATLFSPALYNELLFPAHKKIADYLKSYGKPLMCHSCGKIDVLIPKFIEAGFAAIQPLEAKCGQDVRELKKLYHKKIVFYGNIDVRKLSGTRQDIEEEVISKVEVAKQGGGYIFHSDHSVPPTVSWDNYCYAMELAMKHGKY